MRSPILPPCRRTPTSVPVAEGIVVHLRDRLARKTSGTPEEEELIVTMQGGWKEARALGRDEDAPKGRRVPC